MVLLWTLNRASRKAAAVTYRNPAAHPSRSKGQSPHVKARIAGAKPNETTSARESSSTPNADDECEAREEPVERVEDHGDPDEQRGGIEVGSRRVDDAGVAPQNRFATVKSEGGRKTLRRKRFRGRSSRRRQPGGLSTTIAPKRRQNRFAADHPIADADMERRIGRQKYIHP